MSVSMELLSSGCSSLLTKRPSFCSSSSMAMFAPSLKFQSLLLKPSGHRLSFESPRAFVPKGLGDGVGFRSGNSLNRQIVVFAGAHEDSGHSEIEVEKESEDKKLEGEESEEVWKQTLESFKEQALRLQSVSQEAYEIYSKKAMVILEETSEKLKIQAVKAKKDLGELAKELGEDSIEYLVAATENSPEPVKEVVETLSSSTDDFNDISKVRDFHVGIPYGFLLATAGFLSFMLSGSINSIRFGVILGGALLALSVSSLKSYKRGEPDSLALKGQAAIVAIIFLRDIRIIMTRGGSFFTPVATLVRSNNISSLNPRPGKCRMSQSHAYELMVDLVIPFGFFILISQSHLLKAAYPGAVVAFYLYKIAVGGKQSGRFTTLLALEEKRWDPRKHCLLLERQVFSPPMPQGYINICSFRVVKLYWRIHRVVFSLQYAILVLLSFAWEDLAEVSDIIISRQ
ncbi:hypothetical protein POTOM_053105 [Populus tomentosa]|uniref:Uncharacterized protein n=1 Tax=Populus tomentosa TaxID=118781 RepID=A0A8X7YFE1_POPTO|nr:hypothetical protein POTOM_053105 [Populus tomentosa]